LFQINRITISVRLIMVFAMMQIIFLSNWDYQFLKTRQLVLDGLHKKLTLCIACIVSSIYSLKFTKINQLRLHGKNMFPVKIDLMGVISTEQSRLFHCHKVVKFPYGTWTMFYTFFCQPTFYNNLHDRQLEVASPT